MGRIKQLPRRAFLRGACGVAIGLPALEIMGHSTPARAGSGSLGGRFMTSYVGASVGRAHYPNDTCCAELLLGDRITPAQDGLRYEITPSLQSIGGQPWQYTSGYGGDQPAYDIQDDVSIVSGLTIPWEDGGVIPPGGRAVPFHGSTVLPQLTGSASTAPYSAAVSPTAEQLVATANAGRTTYPSLAYRVEPINYSSGATKGHSASMSWKSDGAGNMVRVDPLVHPGLAFDTLFTGFVPPDPAEAAKAAAELATRKSVLDVVGESADRLLGQLGHADRIRLEQHLDEIRALERRLEELQDPGSPACMMTADPGQDWPIGDVVPGNAAAVETETNKWSNEELRAEVLADLIGMAFTCDLTRSASLMFEHWGSSVNMYPAIGHLRDLHDITHFGGEGTGIGPLGDAIAWHVKHFARLARKLKDTMDPDGTPILDRTVLTMQFEGGWGWDPEGGDLDTHSTENMVVLIAGGRALGLSPGQHIRGEGAHPAAVLLAGVRACGVTGSLGEITEPLAGL